MRPMPASDSLMRQAVITGASSFEVVRAPIPRLQGPDEVLIRTAASGICSGDLMPWYLAKKVGTVLGHEVAGWAVEVGPTVPHIRPGDLVFLHHHAPCLRCEVCRRGDHVHCPTWRASSLDPGGMAEWIRVPAVNAANDTFAVNDLTPEEAVFIEPLGCTVKALRRLPRLAAMPGAVVGCGVMGLLNLAVARALGSGELTAIEPDPARRQAAAALADAVIHPEEAAALAGSMEFVLIGPGHPDVIRQAFALVRPGGTALLFTPTPAGVLTSLDLGELYFREVSLVPSYSCGPDETRQAYELLRARRVEVRPLVTHRFPLDDIQRAHDTARAGGAVLKVLVTFGE